MNFPMTKLEVRGFSISIDGFGADQRPDQPLGASGEQLHGRMDHRPQHVRHEIGASPRVAATAVKKINFSENVRTRSCM